MPGTPSQEHARWCTAITEVKRNEILLRGYRISELMGGMGFASAILLTLTGEPPTLKIGELFEAILVSSIDHGVTPPSALAVRIAASTGAPLNAAVAAGLLSINSHHGGAVEGCMKLVSEGLDRARQTGGNLEQAAAELVTEFLGEKQRLPGLGHRLHTEDPRSVRLFELSKELGIASRGVGMIEALQRAGSRQLGRHLPINVDGAIAALLVDLDFPAELANSLFIMARVAGLIAHWHEESIRQRPMRRIDPTACRYDGPPPRTLEDGK